MVNDLIYFGKYISFVLDTFSLNQNLKFSSLFSLKAHAQGSGLHYFGREW